MREITKPFLHQIDRFHSFMKTETFRETCAKASLITSIATAAFLAYKVPHQKHFSLFYPSCITLWTCIYIPVQLAVKFPQLAKNVFLTSLYVAGTTALGYLFASSFFHSLSLISACKGGNIQEILKNSWWITFSIGMIAPFTKKILDHFQTYITKPETRVALSNVFKSINENSTSFATKNRIAMICFFQIFNFSLTKNDYLKLDSSHLIALIKLQASLNHSSLESEIHKIIEVAREKLEAFQKADALREEEGRNKLEKLEDEEARRAEIARQADEAQEYLDTRKALINQTITLFALFTKLINRETRKNALNIFLKSATALTLSSKKGDNFENWDESMRPTLSRDGQFLYLLPLKALAKNNGAINQACKKRFQRQQKLEKKITQLNNELKSIEDDFKMFNNQDQTTFKELNQRFLKNKNNAIKLIAEIRDFDIIRLYFANEITVDITNFKKIFKKIQRRIDVLDTEFQKYRSQFAAKENSTITAYKYLSSNCKWKFKEYVRLQTILDIEGLDEDLFEKKLAAIGLDTREKLLDKFPQLKNGTLTSDAFFKGLEEYVKNHQKTNNTFFNTLYTLYKNVVEVRKIKLSTPGLARKVSSLIYRLTVAGLVLAPALIAPKTAAMGMGVGFSVLTVGLINSNALNTLNLLNLPYNLGTSISVPFISTLVTTVLNTRRIFKLTPHMEQVQEEFISSDLVHKIRILWIEISLALACTECVHLYPVFKPDIRHHLGSFSQGVFLGIEAAEIFWSLVLNLKNVVRPSRPDTQTETV